MSLDHWTPGQTMRAVVLRSLDFTYAEIAEELGGKRTPKAVKRRLQRVMGL